MHSLSTRHTSGLYRRRLPFGQSVETLNTSGNTRARNNGGLKLKSLLQVKHISSILRGFQINLVLKQHLESSHLSFIPGANCMPKSSGRATVASETQQISESLQQLNTGALTVAQNKCNQANDEG